MNAAITAGVEEMEKARNNNVDEATLQQARQVIVLHYRKARNNNVDESLL